MEKTWKPKTAGILTIIAGAAGIGAGALIALYAGILGTGAAILGGFVEEWIGVSMGALAGIIGIFGAASIGVGTVAIIGGIFALRRRVWGLALASAILAIFSMTPLGILATIFVSMGKKEFERTK